MIRAIMLAVGASPAPFHLHANPDTAWRSLRQLVDGYVEQVHLSAPDADGFRLVAHVNEEGIIRGLPFNRSFIFPAGAIQLFGPIVILRERVDQDGEATYADIRPEDEERISRMLVAVEQAVAS